MPAVLPKKTSQEGKGPQTDSQVAANSSQEVTFKVKGVLDGIFKLLGSLESIQLIDSASLCSLAGRYDNPILLGS
jgi:hypothetical protein